MSRRTNHNFRDNRGGFIVVAALWILGALATLAAIHSIYVANVAASLAVNDDDVRAEAIVSAALELTAYQLTASRPQERPSRGRFGFRMNWANVAVEFCSEAARVDLNKASKGLLAGLFRSVGVPSDDADQYADRIVGWRSAPDSRSQDEEESLYRAAGLNYGPRGAPFTHIGELALVLGLPSAVVERVLRYVTIYSGRSEINIHDAAPEVIAALPGMTPEQLGAVLNDRELLLEQSSSAGFAAAKAETTLESSRAVRVTVRMAFDSGRAITSEAIILIDGHAEPYRVMSWRNDADGEPAVHRAGIVAGKHP
jgi:general secretion pathway protein K